MEINDHVSLMEKYRGKGWVGGCCTVRFPCTRITLGSSRGHEIYKGPRVIAIFLGSCKVKMSKFSLYNFTSIFIISCTISRQYSLFPIQFHVISCTILRHFLYNFTSFFFICGYLEYTALQVTQCLNSTKISIKWSTALDKPRDFLS